MKINQLSLFIENKSGTLNAVCKVLAENNLSIITLSLADTEQFGIMRLIIEDWQKAKDVLEIAGFVVKITEVVALPVDDSPGGLAALLTALDANEINVEYMYAFTYKYNDKALIVFRFEDTNSAVTALENSSIDTVSTVELFSQKA